MTDGKTPRSIGGPKTREWLQAVGIETIEDLEALGAVEAYIRVKTAFPDKVTLNMLWGLQGTLLGIPWNQLPEGMKDDLRQQVADAGF